MKIQIESAYNGLRLETCQSQATVFEDLFQAAETSR